MPQPALLCAALALAALPHAASQDSLVGECLLSASCDMVTAFEGGPGCDLTGDGQNTSCYEIMSRSMDNLQQNQGSSLVEDVCAAAIRAMTGQCPACSDCAPEEFDACGPGYELQGYPNEDDTTGYYSCQNYLEGSGSPPTSEHAVSAGTAGVQECAALCDADLTCTHFGKYGAYCDGPCDSSWETKCFLIGDCGEQQLYKKQRGFGAVYCEKQVSTEGPERLFASGWPLARGGAPGAAAAAALVAALSAVLAGAAVAFRRSRARGAASAPLVGGCEEGASSEEGR